MIDVNWNPDRKQLRAFAVLWLLFFSAVGFWLWRHSGTLDAAVWVWSVALVVGGIGAAFPRAIRPVYITWMALALPIGWVVSHLLLAFVYFGILFPIGVLLRLFGYDPLHRDLDRQAASYWVRRQHKAGIARYFRQF